jgi:hypothetical protein
MLGGSYIDVILESRLLGAPSDVERFEDAISNLPQDLSDLELARLHEAFDDRAAQEEVMWGLLHYMEQYSDEKRLTAFLTSLPKLLVNGNVWVDTVLHRNINPNSARMVLKSMIDSENVPNIEFVRMELQGIVNRGKEPYASRASEVIL